MTWGQIIFAIIMDTPGFLSPDGYSPNVWGKSLWLSMTLIASNVPLVPTRQDSLAYFKFFDNLRRVIPCKSCRDEYSKMIRCGNPALRLRLSDFLQGPRDEPGTARKRVFTWIVRIHAHVNARLKKKRRSSVAFWAKKYSALRKTSRNITRGFPTGDLSG